jgi:hypothetical protein
MSDRATAEDLIQMSEVSPTTGLEGDIKSNKVTQNVAVEPATAEDLEDITRGGIQYFTPSTGGGVGTLDPTSFDFQLSVDGDNEERRAQEQNFFSSLGKGAGRLVGTTATKFLEGIGYTIAGVGALAEQDIDVMLDNGFSALMSEAEEGIKEALPIYQTEKARDPRFWRSMWTHDFWFNDVVDGAAFMASSIIGAKGFDKIGKGVGGYTKIAKEASKLTRAAKLGKTAQGMTSNAANIVDDMNLLTMTAFNSVSEAAFEAKDIKDQLRQQLQLDVEAGLITQEDANARASQAAFETFGLNMLALMPSNYLTNSFIFKKADRLGKLPVFSKSVDAVEPFTKKMAVQSFGTSALTSMVSEGVYEENLQLAIQDYTKDKAKGKQVGPWYEALASNWANNFTTSEGQKSILLGALIGLIPGGVGGLREAKQEQDLAVKTNAFISSVADRYEEGVNYFYKKKTEKNENGEVVETNEFQLDRTGNPIIDNDKVQAVFEAKYREFADFVGAMKAANNGNDLMYDYIQTQRIAQLGFPFYGNEEGVDSFKDYLSAEKEKEVEMLRDSGKEVNEEQLQEIERDALQKAEDFHKLYNYVDQKFIKLFDLGKGKYNQQYKNSVLVDAFTKGVDQQYWTQAKEKIENQISELERKGDTQNIYDQVSPADKQELSKLNNQLGQVNELLNQSYVEMKDLLNESLQRAKADQYAKDKAAEEVDVVDSEITDDASIEIINKTEQQTPDGVNQQTGVNPRTPKPVGKFRAFNESNEIVDLDSFDEATATSYGYEKDPESNSYVLTDHKEGLKHTIVTNENDDVIGDVAAYDKQAIKEGEEISIGISFADNKLSSIKTKDKDGDIQDYGTFTKQNDEEYTIEDLPELIEDLKEKHGIEVSIATKDDSINLGEGGTVETIAKNERRDPNDNVLVPEYGVRHSGSAVAYVWKDQKTGAYVTLSEDFHKEVINLPAEDFNEASFKAVIDVNNKEWNKFPQDVKESLIRPDLTEEEINNLIAIENENSFNNVVDRVPIRFDYSRGELNIPSAGFIHDTAYDFITIPLEVQEKGETEIKKYKLQEKLRTRKVRTQVLRKLLNNEEFVFDGSLKTMGHYNSDGKQKNLGDVLDSVEQNLDSTSVGLAVDTGLIYMDGKETAVGAGIAGNVFIETDKTANGDTALVKVSPAKVSKEHAEIIYKAITQAYSQGSGGFKAQYEGSEVTGDLTRKEVLDMLVHWGKETVIDLTDPTQKSKSYLSNKQLYADVKTRTLNFGKESIPLFGATQAEIDHFVTHVSENKNYTVSKKLTGKTLPKSFSIGSLKYTADKGQTYNGMLLRSSMLTTDLIKVEGTKSLFKQPAVIFDVLGANMDFSIGEVSTAKLKAVEKQSANEAKIRKPIKVAEPIKTPEKPIETETKPKVEKKPDTPNAQRVDSDVAIKSLNGVQDFNNVANQSLIFFRKDNFKSKLGSIVDGWFIPTKQAADDSAQQNLNKIGAFKLSDSKKMAEFDKKFGGFFNWIYASQPVTQPEPPATEQEKKDDTDGQMKDSDTNTEDTSIDDILPVFRSTTYAPANYKIIDLPKELKWLNSNFRQDRIGRKVSVEEIEKLIDLGNDRHAFGQFNRDSIVISKLAEEGSIYHEAFHRVSLGYLKDKQREGVYNDARKKYNLPEASDKVVDERLAEEYRKYAMNKVENKPQDKSLKGRIKAFFKGLYDFLYTWFTGNVRLSNNDVESLFEAVSEGKFKFAQINKDRYEALKNKRYNFEIKGVQFNHIETYPQSKEVISNMFKLLMESSGLVKTNPKTGEVEDILISDLKDVGNININKLYDTLKDKSNRLRNVAKTNTEQAPLATKIANMFDEIIVNQDAMNKALIDHMRVLDIRRTDAEFEIDEITGAGRSELSDFGKSMFESSAKDNTAATIKLFISMLPASNVRSSETGLISLVDFGKTWGRLYYLTEGSLGVEDMMEKIKKASDDNFTYKTLYDKLIKDENLKTQFYVTMNKQNLNFIDALVNMEEGGTDVTFMSSKMQSAVKGLTRDWSSDFFLKSKFVVHGKGSNITFNPEAYNELIGQYNTLLKKVVTDYKNNGGTLANFNEYSTTLSNLFKEINIPLDSSALTVMLRDKDVDISKGLYEIITKDLARVFNANSGIYKHLLGVKQKGVNNENILTAESATIRIADAYARSGEFDMGNTVLGPDGNRYYTIASNTYISDTMKRLKSDPLQIDQRLSANYNKSSRFLTTLKNDPNALELVIQSAFRRTDAESPDKGREYQKITELEDYLTRVNAIREGYLLPPTPADRKFYYFYKGMEKVDVVIDNDGNFNKETLDVYEAYYQDEVRRINAVREEIEDTIAEKLDHADLYEFYHYSTKKPKIKSGEVLVTLGTNKHVYVDRADGSREWLGRGSNFSDFNGFNLNWSTSQVRSAINDLLKDKLEKEITYAKKIGVLERFGAELNNNLLPEPMLEEISEEMFGVTEWEENKDAVLRNALGDFLVNTAVGVFESNKVFTGDPAAFKSTEDELKRLTGYTSTGDNLRTEFPADFFEGEELIHNNDYNITYFNSHEFESSFYDEVYDEHVKSYLREGLAETKEEAKKLATKRLGALKGVDQTDGQTLISPEMYRAISIRLGEWPKWKEDAYQILQKDPKDVSYEEQLLMNDIVMQPLKMTYMKVEYNNGNAIPVFDKMSLATVFRPIYRGTALEKLIDRMELKGEYANKPELNPIHQVKFHTATKTGIKDRRSIYKDSTEKEFTDFNVLEVYPQDFAYLRRQLVTDPHHADHVLAGSQMQKVGVSNVIKDADYNLRNEEEGMSGEDILKHFNDIRGELSNIGRRKYLSDMGINKDFKFVDEGILLEKMREEALNSGMPDYIAESYSTNEKGEKLVEFDALPGNRKWTEARFLSANKKATIDLNLPGNVFIQMTDIGLEKIQKDGTKDPETRLKMINDKGYMEGKVSVSLFRTLIPNYDGITDEERIHYLRKHPELISLGYRIPTQGPNSIYMIEVIDFLPASAGDVVLLPGEGTALGGFDFDIDKLYILRHNYDRTNKIINYKDDTNSTLEQRYIDWVNDNANRDTIKYMNFLKKDQLNAVKAAYKGRIEPIKRWLGAELEKNKSAAKDHLNMRLNSVYDNVKDTENTIYLEDLYTMGKRLFDHLSPDTKQNYFNTRDSIDNRGIKGVAKLMEFYDYTNALLAINHPDSEVLRMMIDNYEAQMVAFGIEESYIEQRAKEMKAAYIDEYKEAKKEGREDIYEEYNYLKNRLDETKSTLMNDLNLTAAKQIAKFSELSTIESFEGFPPYKQNVRKALENRLLDIFFGVGKSEHSYILKTTPLGFAGDVLKDLSKTVRAKSGIESAFSAPLDRTTPRFQMDVKARFKFGGKGIGPMALANVHHTLGQAVDLSLFEDLGIGNSIDISTSKIAAPRYYEGDITPDSNTIFVFGSNPEGRHGAGAAKIARNQFGAIYGQGEGLQGNSYALPTKDLRIKENKGFKSISEKQIIENVQRLYETAFKNPSKLFKIAYRNTSEISLNGYTGFEMMDMFNNAGEIPGNIIFSKEWVDSGRISTPEIFIPSGVEKVTSLSGILGVDNEYITEWISALIDAHVDLAADPYIYYLNANDITNDTLLLLVRAGVGGLNSFKFIAQPSLVEVAQLSENNNNNLGYEIKKPLNEVIRKYERLMKEEAEKEGYTPINFSPAILKDIFVPSKLDVGLNAIEGRSAEWYNYQLNVLKAFDYLDTNYGKKLSATVMASRVDTKKFGSNTSEYINYNKTVNQSLAETNAGTGIRNFDKLLNNTYLKEMMDNSIYLVNDILKDHILEASPQFIKIAEQVLRKNGTEFSNRVDDMIAVSNEIYTAIAAGFFKEQGYLTRKNFRGMIAGDNSIPRQISKLKTDDRFKNNLLLQSLSPIYEEGKPHFLFVRKPDDAGEKDAISRDWGRLAAYSNDPAIQTFAKDLFVYSYITSGFKTGLHTFFDLVPSSLIVDMGYNDYIKQSLVDYNNPEYRATFLDELYLNGVDSDAVVSPLNSFQNEYVEEEGRTLFSNSFPYSITLNEDGIIGYNKNKEPFGKPYIKYKYNGETLLFRYEGYRGKGNETQLLYKFSPKKSKSFKGGHKIKETLSDVTVFKSNKYPFTDAINNILESNMLIPFFNQKVASHAGFTPYVDLITTDITVEEIGNENSDNIKAELSYNPLVVADNILEEIKTYDEVTIEMSSGTLEGWATLQDGSIVHLTYLNQTESGHKYQIAYYGNRIPTQEEVEQHKKECNG